MRDTSISKFTCSLPDSASFVMLRSLRAMEMRICNQVLTCWFVSIAQKRESRDSEIRWPDVTGKGLTLSYCSCRRHALPSRRNSSRYGQTTWGAMNIRSGYGAPRYGSPYSWYPHRNTSLDGASSEDLWDTVKEAGMRITAR